MQITKEQIRAMLRKTPRILGLNIKEKLLPLIEYLTSEEIGLTSEEIAKLLTTHPQIFGYSLEAKLKPTLSYLRQESIVPEYVSNRDLFKKNYVLFSYSLNDRIKVRNEMLKSMGVRCTQSHMYLSEAKFKFAWEKILQKAEDAAAREEAEVEEGSRPDM